MTEPSDVAKLREIKRNPGITMRFPTTGEPVTKYAEENRQNLIEYYNNQYENGWLPCGDNWWLFPVPESDELVAPLPDIWVIRKNSEGTSRIRLRWE